MAAEAVVLRTRDLREVAAKAELTRVSAASRTARASGIAVAGVVIGACSILVPGVHFVAPWLVPLLGFAAAAYFFRLKAMVHRVRARCPDCDAAIDLPGGALGTDPLWLRCSACELPLLFPDAD